MMLEFIGAPVTESVVLASSASLTDVQTAVDAATNGQVVRLPSSSSATWTSQLTIPNTKGLTLDGNGCTITDGVTSGSSSLIAWDTASYTCRLKGFTFNGGSTAKNPNIGMVRFNGTGSAVRVDHCTFNPDQAAGLSINDYVRGVCDHCTFTVSSWGGFGAYVFHGSWNTADGYGDHSWSTSATLGTAEAWFFEDCTFTSSGDVRCALDGWSGMRSVVRYCTFTNTFVTNHGTATSGRPRSARSYEWYSNAFARSISSSYYPMSANGGSGVIHSNTITTSGGATVPGVFNMSYPRRFDTSRNYYGWGTWCGETTVTSITRSGSTATVSRNVGGSGASGGLGVHGSSYPAGGAVHARVTISGASQTEYNGTIEVNNNNPASPSAEADPCTSFTYTVSGTPATPATGTIKISSPWDGNTDATGYPGIDQPGRGTGDLISGDDPSPVAWPNQALDPIYIWSNTVNSVGTDGVTDVSDIVVASRDYYNTSKSGYSAYTYPHPLTA